MRDLVGGVGRIALVAEDGAVAGISPTETEKLELAPFILDGYNEVALYNAFGPGWRYFVQGSYCHEEL